MAKEKNKKRTTQNNTKPAKNKFLDKMKNKTFVVEIIIILVLFVVLVVGLIIRLINKEFFSGVDRYEITYQIEDI